MDERQILAPHTPLFSRPDSPPDAGLLAREVDTQRRLRTEAEATAAQLAELIARGQAELAREREARQRAEAAASELTRVVAAESARAEEERDKREQAEQAASDMAALVAKENARVEKLEQAIARWDAQMAVCPPPRRRPRVFRR